MAMHERANQEAGGEQDLPLPAAGYPISEDAVSHWFEQRYQRRPSDLEVGAIIDAMAQRESTPPHVGPNSEPEGWKIGPSAPPADRR